MLLSEIVTRCQDHLRDTNAVISTTVLKRHINAEYQHLYNKLLRANTAYKVPSTTISVVAGTTEYDLPAVAARIKAVRDETGSSPIDYDPIEFGERSQYQGRCNPYSKFGNVYYQVGAYEVRAGVTAYKKIGILPVATSSKTLTVYYYDYPVDLSSDTDVPLLPSTCHELLALAGAIQEKIAINEDPSGLMARKRELYPDFLFEINDRQADSPRRQKDVWGW